MSIIPKTKEEVAEVISRAESHLYALDRCHTTALELVAKIALHGGECDREILGLLRATAEAKALSQEVKICLGGVIIAHRTMLRDPLVDRGSGGKRVRSRAAEAKAPAEPTTEPMRASVVEGYSSDFPRIDRILNGEDR